MGSQDEFNETYDAGAKDATAKERARCIKLCTVLAHIHEHSAQRIRDEGTSTTLFTRRKVVAPYARRAALAIDAAAHGLRVVAQCIDNGVDPDVIEQ